MYTLKVHHSTHQDGRMKDRDIINLDIKIMVYWVGILTNLNPTSEIYQRVAGLQRGGIY